MNGFNPEGGQVAAPSDRNGSGINFKAVFTGLADVMPMCFNPTKQDICRIKNIPVERQGKIQEPTYVEAMERDEKKMTRLTLLTKFHPNELLAEKDDDGVIVKKLYADDVYFELSWPISAEDELSKGGEGKSQKYRFINESLQSTWAESLDQIKGNEKMKWYKTDTARIAKRGEVLLYNLLSAMYKFAGTKETPITGFKLGTNPTETFEDIVAGDVSMLNDMLDPDAPIYQYFCHDDADKTQRKIAVMLGASISDKEDDHGVPYVNQRVFVNQYVNNCFAKEGRWLPKDAIESIKGEGFRALTGSTLNLAEFNAATSTEATAAAFSEVDDSSLEEATEDFSAQPFEESFEAASDEDFA